MSCHITISRIVTSATTSKSSNKISTIIGSLAIGFFLIFTNSLSYGALRKEPGEGIIVLSVEKNLEADRAGIRPGDILFSWQAHWTKGKLQSAFDLSAIEREGLRGQLSIRGLQNGQQKTWRLRQDDWGITARPAMPSTLLSLYRRGESWPNQAKQQMLPACGRMPQARQALQRRGFCSMPLRPLPDPKNGNWQMIFTKKPSRKHPALHRR
jgi:hypothetical protein